MPATGPSDQELDAAVMGRVGADIYPSEINTPLSRVRTFTRFAGGFAANVSTGLARLGLRIPKRDTGEVFIDPNLRVQLVSAGITGVRFLQTDFFDTERYPKLPGVWASSLFRWR